MLSEQGKTKVKKLKQFSKKFMYVVAFVWVAGAVYGAIFLLLQLILSVIFPEVGIQIDTTGFWEYLKDPLTGCAIAYMAKSAFENHTSMKENYRQNYDEEEFNEDE